MAWTLCVCFVKFKHIYIDCITLAFRTFWECKSSPGKIAAFFSFLIRIRYGGKTRQKTEIKREGLGKTFAIYQRHAIIKRKMNEKKCTEFAIFFIATIYSNNIFLFISIWVYFCLQTNDMFSSGILLKAHAESCLFTENIFHKTFFFITFFSLFPFCGKKTLWTFQVNVFFSFFKALR